MIKFIISALMLCMTLVSNGQIKLPAISPAVEMKQKIGLATVTLSYSRPSLRGRQLFGDEGILVMEQKWRTGANATTKLELSKDIEINGKVLPTGTYVLLTTPQEESWTFHFYPFDKAPYTAFIEREPMLEFNVPTQKTAHSTETLLLYFDQLNLNSARLVLAWGHYKVEFPVSVSEHDEILANIQRQLDGPSKFNYFQAALYLHETQTDLPLALTYIRKATRGEDAVFFQVYREALILKDMKRNEEAVAAAKRSMELSKKAGNDDLVRLSKHIIDELSD